MSRDAKFRRINEVRSQIPHVTHSALSAISSHAPTMPSVSRDDIRRARNSVCMEMTPFGRVLTDITLTTRLGDAMQVEVANPLALPIRDIVEGHLPEGPLYMSETLVDLHLFRRGKAGEQVEAR